MATEDKQRILDWCGADSDVRYVQEGVDPGADFSLVLESAGTELTATPRRVEAIGSSCATSSTWRRPPSPREAATSPPT